MKFYYFEQIIWTVKKEGAINMAPLSQMFPQKSFKSSQTLLILMAIEGKNVQSPFFPFIWEDHRHLKTRNQEVGVKHMKM